MQDYWRLAGTGWVAFCVSFLPSVMMCLQSAVCSSVKCDFPPLHTDATLFDEHKLAAHEAWLISIEMYKDQLNKG